MRCNNQENSEENCSEETSLVKDERPLKSVYRLLMMTFFPSGFWSRLMTRILGDDLIIEIVRSYYTFPKEVVRKMKTPLDLKADFVCWQTGLGLKYLGETILRIKEIIPSVSNRPIDYLRPYANFQLNFEGKWTDVDMKNCSILEIYLPNHCLKFEKSDGTSFIIQPNQEYLTKLLALTVDHIDTLLEDWYPSLGTRFVHTSEGKFLVTRLVPCNLCLMELCDRSATFAEAEKSLEESSHEFVPSNELDIHSFSTLLQNSKEYDYGYESACSSKFPSKDKPDSDSDCSFKKSDEEKVFCFLTEECILRASEQKKINCPAHGDLSLKTIAPDTVFLDLGQHYLVKPSDIHRGKMLGRGAFGFVFRAHIKSKGSTSVTEVAMKMLQPVDPGHGAKKSDNQAYKMAYNKWEREPMQFACKAYCTARQELTILLSLRHPHVVPLVGVCTKPLALVLQLAPLGALDALIREYRRSGARMDSFVILKILLQVSKALEYLHQQHIIYRDLKSENVLAWKMPRPHEVIKEDTQVEVKLADYGISRSTLPTGTKGFGGTEGFMAPEIMKYNGEEEYTEKVDCFSFGMFIYELVALRLPFEGQESVKDHILDGGRPPLTVRETLYPSNLLDLMSLCWAESPKDRPTASQVVSMISAPEFIHQLDTIILNGANPVLSSCVVPNGKNFDTWLTHVGKQTEILTANSYAWINYKSLKCVSDITVTACCCIPNLDGSYEIWLGDANAVIYVFDYEDLAKPKQTHNLDPNSPATAIKSIVFSNRLQLVVSLTTNGKVYSYCRSSRNFQVIDIECSACFTVAVVEEHSDEFVEIWYGHSEGLVTIQKFAMSGDEMERRMVSHYPTDSKTSIMDRMDVFIIISSSSFCWTYLFPGSVIYHWCVEKKEILNKLDCSKLIPCSESLMSISIEDQLSPSKCQVSMLYALKDELFVGTNGGCLIIAESSTLRPVTVFRPHEQELKILHAYEFCDINVTEKNGRSNCSSQKNPLSPKRERFLVTIGKGYRSLSSRYVQISSSKKDKDDQMYYATLWKSGYWI